MNLMNLRKDYKMQELLEKSIPRDPFELFGIWFNDCLEMNVNEPNAMVLATVSGGMPSARVVLLKDFDETGFVFFTNYKSRKGTELVVNPNAALVFFWPELERQVRIEGEVNRISDESSQEYFNSRPFESRVSAAISPQSKVLPSREFLDSLHREYIEQHPDGNIEKPQHWGGFILVPHRIEFWQGRANRLHDRILFGKLSDEWKISRLAP
jgi:pyridoxamine 5'-phosphate oxidase